MMQGSIDISELYEEGIICGETYLYCVENNINTAGDLLDHSFVCVSDCVASELNALLSELQDSSAADVSMSDDLMDSDKSEGCDKIEGYVSYVQAKYDNAQEDLKYELDLLLRNYGSVHEVTRHFLSAKTAKEVQIHEDIVASNALLDLVYEVQTLGRSCCLHDQMFLMCTDVRCKNVLTARYEYFGNKFEFTNWLLTCSKVDIMKIPNVGRKSFSIIWDAIEKLRVIANNSCQELQTSQVPFSDPQIIEAPTEEIVTSFKLLIESKRHLLSVRANNVLSSILDNSSFEQVLMQFRSNNFSFLSSKNCGRKTDKELRVFRDEILSLIGTVPVEEVEVQIGYEKYKSLLSFPDDCIFCILNLIDELKSFPLFYVIQQFIDNMKPKDYAIVQGMLDIYNGQELKHREDIGKELKITGERVRQLREKVLLKIKNFIISIGNTEDVSHYLPNKYDEINLKEGTNFQDNFIYWAISLVNKDWVIVGDVFDVFYNPHGHQINLNVVPVVLSDAYDFRKFVSEFDKVYVEKRTVPSELNLQSFCMKFFRNSIQIALLDDIIYECKRIILRLYDCTSNGDIILLDSNAYRGLSEISEEILREHGAPMTAEEMYAVLLEKYPNQKCKGANSLVGSIHNNPNIRPMGRSRTYSLKEWNLGEMRGGTIREFAEEFILMQPDRIAALEDIGNYVRQFRATSTNSSIQANLMLEASGKFELYTKGETKYIGLKGRVYDVSYIPAEESMVIVRSLDTSIRLFKEFVEQHGRYPFIKGEDVDEKEKRLRRFWNNVLYRRNRGTATNEELQFVKYIEDTYPYHDISRHEYKWRQTYMSICNTIALEGWDALNINEQHWCYKYLRLLKLDQLEDWQVPLMIKLQSLYA